MIRRAAVAVLLALSLAGCSWLERQEFDVCVDVHGKHVCVGRHNGKWALTAASPLTPDEEAEALEKAGGSR